MRHRQQRKTARGKASTRQLYLLGGIIAITAVAIVIIAGSLSRDSGAGYSETIAVSTQRPGDVPQDGHTFGDPEAPVTIEEYLDFQCPFCRRAAVEILPVIEAQYVATGKAKLIAHPIAILGQESTNAAAAAECANDQGEFWLYHDMLFANQGAENSGSFSDKRLKSFAAEAGLDGESFGSCVDAGIHRDAVKEKTSGSRESGVDHTPTFLVNGIPVDTTVQDISAAIEAAAGD